MSTMQSTEGLTTLEKLNLFYEDKKKQINTAVIAVAVLIVGWFGYKKLVAEPNEEKASLAMVRPEQLYAIDSFNLALNGDGANQGFLKVIKKYDGTAAANLARYYAASCYMKMGDAQSALKQLREFDAHGSILEHASAGLLGDLYMETNDAKKAIEQYKTATSDEEDDVFTPIYLQHMAVAYEKTNQADEAIKAYKKIRDDYPQSAESRNVDRSLAQLGVLD